MARPTDVLGPKKVITAMLVLWSSVAVSAYFITSKSVFFAVAVAAGIGLGSIQAASRSFMSVLIPEGKEAEMFGFYAFCGKSSSIIGPLVFGTISRVTGGNQRVAVVAIATFFIVGGLLLRRVADPLAELESLLARYQAVPVPGLPRFCGGAVGYAGYDVIRYSEMLTQPPEDDRG